MERTVSELRTANAARLQHIKEQRAALASQRAKITADHARQMAELRERYTETADLLEQTRKVLIKELCGIFGLRRARKEVEVPEVPIESHGTPAATDERKKLYNEEYRIVNVTFPTQGDYWSGSELFMRFPLHHGNANFALQTIREKSSTPASDTSSI